MELNELRRMQQLAVASALAKSIKHQVTGLMQMQCIAGMDDALATLERISSDIRILSDELHSSNAELESRLLGQY